MDNKIKFLYSQIKERKISHDDAARQFKLLETERNQKINSASNLRDEQKTGYESKVKKDRDTISYNQESVNMAAEFYTISAKDKSNEFQEEYLTFGPLEEKIPGFSMSRVFLNPEKFPDEMEFIREKQIEMRQVLFCKEDFNHIKTAFDFGCGHGTDVIQIAALYPHIQMHGFTITQAQAILGNERIARMNLGSQAAIFHKDSSKDRFPARYDVIFGIEVSCHIRNKDELFQNIASSLNEEGHVLLMDFISNLKGPIVDPNIEISIPTSQAWIDILSKHHLMIDEIIDVSPQVANFLYDPECEQNVKEFPKVTQDSFRNFANCSLSLENGWISYCLIKLSKDNKRSESMLRAYNAGKLSNPTPYPEAFEQMLHRKYVPYPKGKRQLEEHALAQVSDSMENNLKSTLSIRDSSQHDVQEIRANLTDIFINILGFEAIEFETLNTFQELGITSVNAVELVEGINTTFRLSLPTSVVFECSTLDALAKIIVDSRPDNQPREHTIKKYVTNIEDNRQETTIKRIQATESSNKIAIIGISCRCAGANGPEEFWELVSQGKDCIQDISNRNWLDFFRLNSPNVIPGRYGAIDDLEEFDPLFFHISPKEAETMDVTHRLFLEESYKALEDSGYSPLSLREQQVGTFLGTMGSMTSTPDYSHFSMLGSETSILASRLAYCLDLKGPAMAINTSCSSSLVAIDLASQQLKNRQIDLAFAGGITVYTHPGAFISMNNAGMLSPTGICRPFDNAADGIVVGDGVGIVILKRLQDAIQDGDQIYGVIRGSRTNQDGQTSGITVPSFLAQSQLEESLYRENQICVEDIQYIETHGTATKLGDPVEVDALNHTFKKFTSQKRFCAIGSLKANIGHTTAAAGVLSVIKVLLSLGYKKFPPSINFSECNEHINFEDSPFFVNTSLREWAVNAKGSRLAAVSSFGFSGTNAHMILEEYQEPSLVKNKSYRPHETYIIVLSAKNEEQLKEYANKLLIFFTDHGFRHGGSSTLTTDHLQDIAYTLQVGREAMEERMALIVGSIKDLEEKLHEFLKGQKNIKNLYRGQTKRIDNTVEVFAADEDLQKAVDEWISKGKYAKLLDFWVKGLIFDWNKLYGNNKPRRMSLPTYPFARELYPVPQIDAKANDSTSPTTIIHPLLHRNTSNISQQRFSSTFTGQEFFFADHVLNGQKVLPEVTYLEMVRAAVKEGVNVLAEGKVSIQLKNIIWAKPIVVNSQPKEVHIGLFPDENEQILYEIYTETDVSTPLVHGQGVAVFRSQDKAAHPDLPTLKKQINTSRLSSGQCYEYFTAMGIDYGPGHQSIQYLSIGSNQVLAKLSLPSSVLQTQDQFVMHPSIMDGAFQSILGLIVSNPEREVRDQKRFLPLAVEELDIYTSCTSSIWVWIRYCNGRSTGENVQMLDIDLYNDLGKLCVRMKGVSLKIYNRDAQEVSGDKVEGTPAPTSHLSNSGISPGPEAFSDSPQVMDGSLMFHPHWIDQSISAETTAVHYSQHLVLLCEINQLSNKSLKIEMNGVRFLILQCKQENIEKRFQAYANQVFEEIQHLLQTQSKNNGKILIQLVVPNGEEGRLFVGLAGLLKTAQLENPKLIGQLIEVEFGEDPASLVKQLKEDGRCPGNHSIRYQDGKRWITTWKEIETSQEPKNIPWKNQGIYLITGGAGGLGLIFAKEIASKTRNSILILTGRSNLNQEKKDQVNALKNFGARIEYRRIDVTQSKAATSLIQSIVKDFGGLNGIIHSAGVIHDNFILKKTKQEIVRVLAPKVSGLVTLDQTSKDINLDFFILCSSIAGCLGNPGQADYATANAFMDGYAHYRNSLVASKKRQGQTLSINWPLWKEGGMQVNEEIRNVMRQNMGLNVMETPVGLRALYQGLASRRDQVVVMVGDIIRIKEHFLDTAANIALPQENQSIPQPDLILLQEKTLYRLKVLLSEHVKLDVVKIDGDNPLENYGIDSVIITQLNQKLSDIFGALLPKTLFFEHRNLQTLAEYLISEYPQACLQWTGLEEPLKPKPIISSIPLPVSDELPVLTTLQTRQRSPRRLTVTEPSAKAREHIAIIGISGRYPQAKTLDKYWQNLKKSITCISEIPEDRWSLEDFFEPDQEEAEKQGKSYSKWGGFLEGIADFDPLFFNISPREAAVMDPQERLFIQSSWEVLEDAGYTRERLTTDYNSQVGVFAGITKTGFELYGPELWRQGEQLHLRTSFSSVANRISYLLNLQGPSMPIDTMCSSSLTAIYEACEHIHHGACEMAIAGGVNLYLHPSSYIELCAYKMLAPDGNCKSFADGGNGFVPGEGVGVVLLKRLSKAIQDQDQIHAVIIGASINHGGKTNGYTVPNPTAQSKVIRDTLDKAGVDARAVSFIEAHGTGTALGDPIEITGLAQAFRKDTQDTAYCAIGSVKSNIGHLEAAAGIAGLTKIVLQMKHQIFVPSLLHGRKLNPMINFAETPFMLQQELGEWKRPLIEIDGVSKEYPRIAGISSFGAGGSNAHVILQEYEQPQSVENRSNQSDLSDKSHQTYLIILSAKNEDRLREIAKNLHEFILHPSSFILSELAYTLQVGREAMEERLGFIVNSIEELKDKLHGFLEGQNDIEDLYRGQIKHNRGTLGVFAIDEDLQQAVDNWIAKRKYVKLLNLWVKGLIIDWNKLYGENKPCRISLPTYPFLGKRYWIPKFTTPPAADTITSSVSSFIHPLLHKNTSDFSEQRFSSTFTGHEFFLEDQVVKGLKILPGVACLEMARVAVQKALGALLDRQAGILLKNVVWGQPIAVNSHPKEVHIKLLSECNGDITYEIFSESEKADAKCIVHNQGRAQQSPVSENSSLDIPALLAECSQSRLNSSQCYEACKAMGIDYGPGHQAIKEIYIGNNRALVKLSLPSHLSKTRGQFVLHPSLVNGALQSIIGLNTTNQGSGTENRGPVLPLTLQELHILSRTSTLIWALVQSNKRDQEQKLDLELCDDQGTVCVRMKGLVCHESLHSSITTRHSLQPTIVAESVFSNKTDKPTTVSLQFLSDDKSLSTNPDGQSRQPITLSSTNLSLSQPRIDDNSNPPMSVNSSITVELLQDELATTLAKALYMERNEVDPDRPFIDLGMDSIVGVEWIKTINKKYETQIPTTKTYDYPTINEFAEFLKKELNKQSKQPLRDSVIQCLSSAPDDQNQQPITLSSTNLTLSQPEIDDNSNPPMSVNSSITVELLQDELATTLAKALYMERNEVDLERQFIDLGMDSIVGVEWIKTINKKYETKIPATKTYDYPTIREFAEFLKKELNKQGKQFVSRPEISETNQSSSKVALEPIELPSSDLHQITGISTPTLSSFNLTKKQHFLPQISSHNYAQGEHRQRQLKKDTEKKEGDVVKQHQEDLSRLGTSYGLVLSTVHSLKELSLSQWAISEPNQDEVTIQVKASAINFPDTMCVRGLYPTMPDYPFVPGFEVSGVVARKGSQVSEIDIGDEVIALTGKQLGGHASHVNVPIRNIVQKPKNVSFEEACSLPVVFGTVNYAFELAKLAPKEHVLIQTATGGCGLAALQLAHLKECVCYATSSRQEKLDILRKFEIPHVFNYKTSDFDREIKRITKNRGIDVVLNMLSGDGIQKGLNCLGPSGRYLELAVHALKTSQALDLSKLVRNQSIYSIDLRQLSFEKKGLGKEMLKQMKFMIESEQIVPIVSRIYPIHQIREALEYVGQGKHIGKVVISHTNHKMIDCLDHCLQRLLEHKRICKQRHPAITTTTSAINGQKKKQTQEGIAIIGMSGQFPKSKTLAEFWDNLAQGKDCISEIPTTRWSIDQYYDPDAITSGKIDCKWMGVLEDVDCFDPLFFNISPAEAALMDPQQRLFLENCWHCIEDSGISPAALSGSRCGVFAGCGPNEFGQFVNGQELNAQALLGGAASILPARISYILNLKGPSLSIDTSCSSSLVAIGEACNSLQLQTCDLALAGGVSVLSGPNLHIMTTNAGMLSKDGRCFTFDERANGFVPGEGVGIILLKRLSDAIHDRDPIYGVIKGWGVNQDGKTNGITAPSVNSQISLEKEVYERFNINPETISLVEAHGTGTKLGDPIEVEALIESFQSYTRKKNYCALGSVKSNTGHLLAAAGIAGIIKVLLALRHRMLPPTINFETLNSHITLENSPFYINTEIRPWKIPEDATRRASVSSFGFSGTNAHLVIEEWLAPPVGDSSYKTYIIVLSAKNKERLREVVKNLLDFTNHKILNQKSEILNLSDLAYTLQVGRKAMEERLALIVESVHELGEKLKGFMEGKEAIEELYRGQVKRNNESLTDFTADEDIAKTIDAWMAKGKYGKLLRLWVKGLNFDWNSLYGNSKPRRISLPAYPFAREHYPVHQIDANPNNSTSPSTIIHPLLQQNTSNLSEQRFSSTFTGQEFFLADHVVQGQKVLPKFAYLEMARAAVEQAAGSLADDQTEIQLKNVIWAQPIITNGHAQAVHIGLCPEEKGQIRYEIYTEVENREEEPVIHCQGIATLNTSEKLPPLDLPGLRATMDQGHLNSKQCYDAFKTPDIDYSSGHQCLESVYIGKNQVLAKLSMSSSILETQDQYVLHPNLMNSALQASINLEQSNNLYLPFALESLDIIGKCTASMWAWIRYSNGNASTEKAQKLDIDLYGDQGTICLRMKGLSSRVFEREATSTGILGTLTCQPIWKEKAIPQKANSPEYSQHLVMLCEIDPLDIDRSERTANTTSNDWVRMHSESKDLAKRYQDISIQVFETIRGILEKMPKGNILIQILIPSKIEEQVFSGLSGLLKTAHLENPKILEQLIIVDPGETEEELHEKLKENSRCPEDTQIRYRKGQRQVLFWKDIPVTEEVAQIPWKMGGVYLITGGAGGIGMIFAKEIARSTKDSTLILTGRSRLSREKQIQLKELEALGAQTKYMQCDVTRKETVVNLIQSVQEKFGNLHGIIHSAGVIRDNFILKKTTQELKEVLAPKVAGLVNVDQASRDLPLDFFVLFSSLAGPLGNIGQADYACANAFMDGYARYRNDLVATNQRQGRTLSINWPLWKEGGMQVDETNENMMRQSMGMIAMQTPTGIRAFYQSLGAKKDQVIVIEGDLTRLRKLVSEVPSAVNSLSTKASIQGVDLKLLRQKTLNNLKGLFGETIKLSMAKIDAEESLESYGIDSIMITRLNQKLELIFREISKTLFFEYQTLAALADYFIGEYPQECMAWSKLELPVSSRPEAPSAAGIFNHEVPKITSLRSRNGREGRFSLQDPSERVQDLIAIIGISGRYPQAKNLEEYWKNLETGKDCITEIPEGRWSMEGFFHPDPDEAVAQDKSYSKWGGFVEGFADFDPLFFNISPKEAMNMDPQERLFIESCWEVLEDAGYTKERLADQFDGRVGVFAGITKTGFNLYGPDLRNQGEKIYPNTSFSSVANRISYLLNLQGPSMPIDTMCSSSLTAIHEACEHLHRYECEAAIAGGVNLYLHPTSYIELSALRMLSVNGQCKSFGEGSNGFVPGEGVGVVFLKRLSQAITDQDHIYAVIRGTGINHGGKTNGFTVPNPNAQSKLISETLDKAGINARTIGYIEAHGTGTELGDPIEISGLTQAFCKDTQDTQFCAIGSAKSNLGHLESAAGIAGVTKVLLQLKHKKIVQSLHAKELNPNINFAKTPFVVQQKLGEWNRPILEIAGETREYPRRAGISSFGAGGSNAHVILEEYEAQPPVKYRSNQSDKSDQTYLIILSAKNEDRLREIAKNLHEFILHHSSFILSELAYTLQVGREPMEERLGFTVGSVHELTKKLQSFIEGQDNIENLYRGQVKRHKEMLAVFRDDEELQEGVDKWIQHKKYEKLLDLWVKGLTLDWNKFYGDRKPSRISLPSYPFAQERYWVAGGGNPISVVRNLKSEVIHPLLHKNTSNLSEQRFSSTFTSQEFFFADHIVKGQKVILGVAYLEMARAAVEQAAEFSSHIQGIRLKNIVWAQPIEVNSHAKEVHIGLFAEGNSQIMFEIYTEPEHSEGECVIHSQGVATLISSNEAPPLDLADLQAKMNKGHSNAEQGYSVFKASASDCSSGHQCVKELYTGPEQVLAKLTLPSSVAETLDKFVLHPGIMDSVLQASIGLVIHNPEPVINNPKPILPFALDELEITGASTASMWAWIRRSDDNPVGEKRQKLDIDLCDDQGTICTSLKGITVQLLNVEKEISAGGNRGIRIDIDHYLTQLIFKHLKVPDDVIKMDIELEDYGIDSVSAATMVHEIKQKFSNIPQSLFLEYKTLGEIKSFIMENNVGTTRLSDVHEKHTVNGQEDNPFDIKQSLKSIRNSKNASGKRISKRVSHCNISIIGMAGQFPGAGNIDEFWDNLATGKVTVLRLPENRMRLMNLSKDDLPEAEEIFGGYLDNIEYFDYKLFKIPFDEAKAMDPQLRKLIEVIWQAILNAGSTVHEFRKEKTGLFVTTKGHSGYGEIVVEKENKHDRYSVESPSLYANRISNILNIKGPSELVETGCSSFLVAIKHAITAIRDGRCKQAIVAAAELSLSPHEFRSKDTIGLYSTKKSTKSFAVDSDGYIKSEAIGAIILKSEEQANYDHDPIYATIKSVGVCHGGKAPLKWYSPNITGQKLAIEEAIAESGIAPDTITYIEAEANGSQLGDASEIIAIQSVYGDYLKSKDSDDKKDEAHRIRIGSLKPLIGHAENASTFTALAKLIWCMQHHRMLGVHGLGDINKNIELENNFEILKNDVSWNRMHKNSVILPRRGAIHSLGIGGVNAHLILEEWDNNDTFPLGHEMPSEGYVFIFSGKTEANLQTLVENYICFFSRSVNQKSNPRDLLRIEYTLQHGREEEKYRLAVIANTLNDLINHLTRWRNDSVEDKENVCCSNNMNNKTSSSEQALPKQDDVKHKLQKWLSEKALVDIARAWAHGHKVNWAMLHDSKKIRKMNLPTSCMTPSFCWHNGIEDKPILKITPESMGTIMLTPRWTEKAIDVTSPLPFSFSHKIIFCDWPTEKTDKFEKGLQDIGQPKILKASSDELSACFLTYAQEIFQVVRDILSSKPKQKVYVQVVLPNGLDRVYLHGLTGLMKTARQENSHFIGQVIVMGIKVSTKECISRLKNNLREPKDTFIQYIDEERRVQGWSEITGMHLLAPKRQPPIIWEKRAVVLITGGAGSLGLIFAKEIAQKAKQATLILTGRSAIAPSIQREITQLESWGATVAYIQADISKKTNVDQLIGTIQKKYGSLTDIIHSAGVIQDSYIIKKSLDDVDAVLKAKVSALCHLDEATKAMNLNSIILFSSLAGAFGNAGQADYAMGNAFMDAYAIYRNQLVVLKKRHGRTLSINWPFWANGGMQLDNPSISLMQQRFHMLPLPKEIGIKVLEQSILCSESQILVMYGMVNDMRTLF